MTSHPILYEAESCLTWGFLYSLSGVLCRRAYNGELPLDALSAEPERPHFAARDIITLRGRSPIAVPVLTSQQAKFRYIFVC